MKAFGIFIMSLALVAYAESKSTGETAPANRAVTLTELIAKAQADIAKLGKELHTNLNLPDQSSVVETLQTQSTNLVNNVKSYIEQMSAEIKAKSPEMEKMWSGVKTSLNKVADDIAAQIPVAKDQVAQLEAKFLKAVDTIVKQSDLATQTLNRNSGVIQEDVAQIAKKAVEMAVGATQQPTDQVHQNERVLTKLREKLY